MKIRIAKEADFQILWKILTETPELQSDATGNTYDKDWLKAVIKYDKENLVLIAEENNVVQGFLIAHHFSTVKQTILNDIFVFPKFRGEGIATKLVEECEKQAKKMKFKYITQIVRIDNKKMQKFNEKIEYKKGNAFYFYEKRLK